MPENTKKTFIRDFFRNTIVQWLMIATSTVNLANWGALAFFIRKVDFPIILHYNVYFGVDIIGNWWETYFLPAAGTVIFAVNVLLAYFFYQRKERIAS